MNAFADSKFESSSGVVDLVALLWIENSEVVEEVHCGMLDHCSARKTRCGQSDDKRRRVVYTRP